MDLPELELPESNLSRNFLDASKATLANKVDEYIKTNVDNSNINYSTCFSDSEKVKKDTMCQEINKVYSDHRRNIAELMHQHIISSGGVADSYPTPYSMQIYSFSGYEDFDTKHSFSYFTDDYIVGEKGLKHKTDGLVYRNGYEFPGTKEYNELMEKEKALDKVIDRSRKGGSKPLEILAVLGFIYLLYGLLAIILDVSFGIGEEQIYSFGHRAEGSAWFILYFILEIPYSIAGLLLSLPKIIRVISTIFVCGVILFGMAYCAIGHKIESSFNKGYKSAKKTKKKLLQSSEYARIVKENNEQKQANEQLAEQWHQAWFRWYKECV